MGEEIQKIKELIDGAERSVREAKRIYQSMTGGSAFALSSVGVGETESENVIEGRFDGQSMIDDAGKMYPVSANYASKSKLVEGDRLKLTITDNGSFIFKQIGPIERNRVIATIREDGTGRGFVAEAEDKTYKILFASVTYFKVQSGDKVVLLVPRDKPSIWGAIENVLETGFTENLGGSTDTFVAEDEDHQIINSKKVASAKAIASQESLENQIGDFEW